MNKSKFLKELRHKLKKLKREERNKYIEYYDEIISDIVESGTSEEDAIKRQGSIEQIASDILANTNPTNIKFRDWRGITLTISSSLLLLSCIFSAILQKEFEIGMSSSTGIIGGADSPTAILVAEKIGPPWGLYIATAVVVVTTVVYYIRRRKRN